MKKMKNSLAVLIKFIHSSLQFIIAQRREKQRDCSDAAFLFFSSSQKMTKSFMLGPLPAKYSNCHIPQKTSDLFL